MKICGTKPQFGVADERDNCNWETGREFDRNRNLDFGRDLDRNEI